MDRHLEVRNLIEIVLSHVIQRGWKMNVEAETGTQREQLHSFFQLFLEGTTGNIELRRLIWNAGEGKYGPLKDRLFCRDLARLAEFSANGAGDVFHGINPRKPGRSTGAKEDISEIVCVASDIDFKTTPRDKANQAIKNFSPRHTMAIGSGNGLHLYWFLKVPLIVRGVEEIDLAEGISKGIAGILGGDHTHDVTRILRTPSRKNSKYAHAPMCEIIGGIGVRYELDELKRFWVPTQNSGGAKVDLGESGAIPERFEALLAKNRTVKATWNGERPDLTDQSGSGYDMAMASLLAKHNFTPGEIAAVLRRMPSGKGPDATDEYLKHTIRKALAGVNGDGTKNGYWSYPFGDDFGAEQEAEGTYEPCEWRENANSKGTSSSWTDETSWPDPKELPEGVLPVPSLDAMLIPEPLRPWLTDIALRMQCPLEFPTIGAIIGLASLIGRKCGIRPKKHDDWTVVPNLYGAVIGRPGIMKSPALNEVLKPLRRLEAEAAQKHEDEMKQFKAEKLVREAKKEVLKSQIKGALTSKKSIDNLTEELSHLDEEEPTAVRFIVNDSTVEKLGEILNENPNGVLHFRDELIGWLRTLDREGHENDRAFYLEAWNGDGSYIYDRIGRGTKRIGAACLSILGGIQPGPLTDYLRAAHGGGRGADGLVQRFQLAVYPDTPQNWTNVDEWPNTEAKNRAFEIFKKLADQETFAGFAGSQPGVNQREAQEIPFLRFAPDAQELFDHWRADLEHKLLTEDEHPVIETHLSKYRSLMPSLALIFHLIERINGKASGPIPPVSLQAARMAAAWCDFLEAHARRIYQSVTRHGVIVAKLLGNKIKAGRLHNPFTGRKVYINGWSDLSTTDDVQLAAEILEDYAWLKSKSLQTNGRGRPTIQFWINPKLSKGNHTV
jgi:putative DNA primase/helicase